MLAVCTYTSLVLLDPPTLKRPPTTAVSPRCTLSAAPTAGTWAADNSALFIATNDHTIRRFDPAGTPAAALERGHPVAALACKDGGATLVYATHDQVVVCDAASGAVAYTLDTHAAPVAHLALSGDAALLASTSNGPGAVHVHTLAAAAAHTVLGGLPAPGVITACAFHTHTKNRLLLGVDGALVVYDVARPAAPLKTVQLEKTAAGAGAVAAIACSPFSKSLIAVGCASGAVHLVDLDKEKGLFRTLALHVGLTSLVFSPEGAALYAGTETGKVLVLDLRALDKPPKSITVSAEGHPVVCMAVQRKLKPGERPSTTASALTKRRVGADTTNLAPENKASGSTPLKTKLSNPRLNSALAARMPRTRTISTTSSTPARPSSTLKADPMKSTPLTPRTRTISTQSVSPKPPVPTVPAPMRIRTTSSGTSASSRVTSVSSTVSRSTKLSSATSVTSSGIASPVARKSGVIVRKSHTPPKSPLGDNADTDATTRPFPTTRRPLGLGGEENTARPSARPNAPRIRTTSAVSSRSTSTRVPSGSGPARSTISTAATLSPAGRPRPRTTSSTNAAAAPKPRPGPSSRPLSVASPSHTALSLSPIPPVPSLPVEFRDGEQLTEINLRWEASRTPSPANDDDDPPDTPLPARLKGKEKEKEQPPVENVAPKAGKTNVLGLGTPELRRWIAADAPPAEAKWEERRIAMVHEPEHDVQIESIVVVGEDDGGGAGPSGSASAEGAPAGPETHADRTVRMTVQISPRRPPPHPLAGWAPAKSPLAAPPDGAAAPAAHDVLHALIRDAMYDFRRETKAEVLGLHLDLVRMGRSWRKEMREALDRWGEELNEVRRENDLLRQENERLRRGY